VGQPFICPHRKKGHRQVSQPLLHNAFCLLVTPPTVAGQQILEMDKKVKSAWYKFGRVRGMLETFPLELLRAPNSFLVMHICRATFEQPTTIPRNPFVHCTLTTHFNNQPWISAGRIFLA